MVLGESRRWYLTIQVWVLAVLTNPSDTRHTSTVVFGLGLRVDDLRVSVRSTCGKEVPANETMQHEQEADATFRRAAGLPGRSR